MLSVLIPTYNYSALPLVKSIYKQLDKRNIPFEVVCFDNGSKSSSNVKNEEINNISNCRFQALEEDGGRSKIKNILVKNAKYSWLLFLDSDVLPVSNSFISDYVDAILKDSGVVFYGGLKYYNDPPSDNKMLRWVYGKHKEEVSYEKRNLNPQKYFTAANFVIKKSIFNNIKFDEELTEYGHEDTLLALDLEKENICITQMDNPVYHLGLDNNAIFLEKIKKSIDNLVFLHNQGRITNKDNKLLNITQKINKIGLHSIIVKLFLRTQKRMETNLCSKVPSMVILDIYKIGYASWRTRSG